MAKTLVQHITDSNAAAAGNRSKMFGVEIGIVTNVQDPDKLGRVKIALKRMKDPDGNPPESWWARVAQPAAGAGRGFYWLPEVNDEVLVAFEMGEPRMPYVIGALWNGKDKPMDKAYNDDNTTRFIQTKSGHQIILEDKKDEEKIIIADKSGNRTLTFDVKNKKFLIEAKEGDIELHAEKKIVLDCEDLEIKTSKSGKMTIGTTFDLKSAQTMNIQSDATLNIKASRVNIN
jgi:uncharacterized protein involved in type VI secretion and phage assembly